MKDSRILIIAAGVCAYRRAAMIERDVNANRAYAG